MSSCSKRCVVNGCRVRMVHRHDGKKFKSKIRPWYTFQEPRVGRDYKRDKNPDKIPWRGPEFDVQGEGDLLVSNDTTGLGGDPFMGDSFVDDDLENQELEENSGKRKKKRKGDELIVEKKEKGDPWDIENVEDEPDKKEIIADPSNSDPAQKVAPKEEPIKKAPEKKLSKKEQKKKDKEEEKKYLKELREEREKKTPVEEVEEEDDWGF